MTEFLGRAKSARRSESDNERGYRNGYGRPRRLTLSSGTVQLRRPRVRNTEEEFESRLLPLFVNRTRKVAELIPQLYLCAQGHEAPRAGVPKTGNWRRTSGHLGSSAQRLSSGGRATLLEPQDPKRIGQASKATAGPGQTHAAYHPLRPDSDRG